MIEFMIVKSDISGISKLHSGEATVAKFGDMPDFSSYEDSIARPIIKKECKDKKNQISVFNLTIDDENSIYVLHRKMPHLSKYEAADGAACTQVIIGFGNKQALEQFLMSSLFDYYFFDLDISAFIEYYLNQKKPYEITLVSDYQVDSHKKINKNIEYQIIDKSNTVFITEQKHLSIVILLFICKKNNRLSVFCSSSYIDKLLPDANAAKDLYITGNEYNFIHEKIRNFSILLGNLETMKALDINQIQDVLININKSIDMNLKTIEVLSSTSNNKSPFLNSITKKKTTSNQLDATISNAASNIESLIKIQKKFLDSLESQIGLR